MDKCIWKLAETGELCSAPATMGTLCRPHYEEARRHEGAKLDELEAMTRSILETPDLQAGTRRKAESTLKKIDGQRKKIG
jgi:hypothetical protein